MSRDIRSYFNVLSKKPADSKKNNPPSLSLNKKKPQKLVDSDDEDIVTATPQKTPSKKSDKRQVIEVLSSDSEDEVSRNKTLKKAETKSTKKISILSSDSEDEVSNKISKKSETKENNSKLKPANIEDVFKNVPIKQSKVEFTPKPTPEPEKKEKKSKNKKKDNNTELGIHNDAAFEKTLMELDDDDDIFEQSFDIIEQSILQAQENDNKSTTNEPKESNENKPSTSEIKKDNKISSKQNGSTQERKRSRTDSSGDRNTSKKKKMEHTDSGIDPGQEAHEKKRYSAILYQKYLNRGGPKHHGMKEIPKGKADCLKNLCFLRTGVLDSLESEEFDSLIKDHGGRTVQSVSKKVNYLVVGDDPGPSKLSKAESLNIKTINEDELLDLILVKSGMEPKYCKKDTSLGSEDLGIEMDTKESSPENKKPEKETHNHNEKPKPKSPQKTETKTTIQENKSSQYFNSKPSCSKASTSQSELKVQKTEPIKTEMKNSQNLQTKNIDPLSLSLAEKYKPTDLKLIIGQSYEGSNMYKLRNWLRDWCKNQDARNKKNITRPTPWAKNDNGAFFKCALLSGPPGVGKTTTATLVAKDLGLDVVEFNASDTRSKRLLREEVSQLLSSKTIAGFATGQGNVSKNRVLLMDEVDGMAGNEDRGGIQELIQLIKNSSIPIVCMCNDRNHQKMRSLLNHCFELRFNKPRPEQITGAMMTVCFKEKINISAPAVKELVIGAGCDVRQVLNHLSLWAANGQQLSVSDAKNAASNAKKDVVIGPWEVCRTIFTEKDHKDMSLADKARLFFYDYSLGPLFVQENYLKVKPSGGGDKKTRLLKVARAADAISRGDIIDAKIRSNNNWSLLESQAMFSSVLPGYYMSGEFFSQINFPAWLGKNSKKNKCSRLISEIQTHVRTSTSASKMAVKLDYLVHLRNAILRPLQKGMDGVDKAVEVMKNYNLLREDFDSLLELGHWKRGKDPMANIETKVKTAFTRTYNKKVTLLPYAPNAGVTKKKVSAADNTMYGDEEEIEESDNEDDDISKNTMIKLKKPTAKGKKNDEAGTSKAKDTKAKPRKPKESKAHDNKKGKQKKK